MNLLVVRIFYAFIFVVSLFRAPNIFRVTTAQWTFEAWIPLFCFASLWGFIVLACRDASRWARIGVAVLFAVLMHGALIHGNLNRPVLIWVAAAIAMVFVETKEERWSFSAETFLDVVQVLMLSEYFSAGLWKLQNLWESHFNLHDFVFENVAYSIALGNDPVPFIWPIFENAPILIILGFTAAFIFQTTCCVPIFKKSLRIYWAVSGILFHLLCGLALDVWYTDRNVALVAFFIVFPYLHRYSRQPVYE